MLLLVNIVDEFVYLLEVALIIVAHQIESANVEALCLTYHDEEDVLADLLLADEILVIHDGDGEVSQSAGGLRVSELAELPLEVRVKLVHASTKSVQEILTRFLLEFEVIRYVLVDLNVVLELRENKRLDERMLADILLGLALKVGRLHVYKSLYYVIIII